MPEGQGTANPGCPARSLGHEVNEHPVLRFGLLVDGSVWSAWQRRAIEALLAGGDAELVLTLVNSAGARTIGGRRRRLSLWNVYNNGWVARRSRAVRRVDCADIIGRAPTATVVPDAHGRYAWSMPEHVVERVRHADVDVLVRFGFGILRGEILSVPRHGVWSFHHDDERVVRGGPPSFWEVDEGHDCTSVLLQRLTDRLDGGTALARWTFPTIKHSYPRNRDRVSFGGADMLAAVARRVRHGARPLIDPAQGPSTASIRRDPTNSQMVRFVRRQAARILRSQWRGVTSADVWTIGIGDEGVPPTWLPELRPGGYLADPFPVVRDDRLVIFVEEFDERSGLGTIGAIECIDGTWRLTSRIIDVTGHASFPSMIIVGSELFCVPETWQANSVGLWRCVRFPDRWEHEAVLVEGCPVVDPTVFEWDGRWWLLGTVHDDEPDSKLFAWTAADMRGPYVPHPLNPIKVDAGSSRPAGNIMIRDGILHRPAQDCSGSYGSAVVVNRVDALDDEGLIEVEVERMTATIPPFSMGCHTLNIVDHPGRGHVTVIDGRRYRFDLHRARREVVARLRRRVTE